MPLTSGTKLGPYEILSPIGAGGMGEVYRAHDSRLGRDVAIKISAGPFTERFEREARAVAALNHPNICTLHDVGPNFLVMELLEGPTLAERIAQGPMPVEEVLRIARDIAAALEAAHEKGIVHRDLKPANVKITSGGAIKVLDFGLAKTQEAAAPASADSPTLLGATHPGMIVGTAAYMAPEQARGKSVDKRADIWAFGVVIYEMLTGQRLFEGETVSDILAAVLKEDPKWTLVPKRFHRLLQRCLERDPKRRLRDIGDFELLLDGESAKPEGAPRRWLWPVCTLAAIVAAAIVSAIHFRELPPSAPQPVRFDISAPEGTTLLNGAPVVSPDGQNIAFLAATEGTTRLWIRKFDSLQARPLADSENVDNIRVFWSPDSRYVAFTAGGKLKKADASGGAAQVLCDVPGSLRGGSWNRQGEIIFGQSGNSGIRRVSERGGTPLPVTAVDTSRQEFNHDTPWFLPDGRHFLYNRSANVTENGGIFVGALDEKPDQQSSKPLVAGVTVPSPAYAPSSAGGYLLFSRQGTLVAQPFNADKLELEGDAVPLVENVRVAAGNTYSISATALAYRSGLESAKTQNTWFDRSGKKLGAIGPPGSYRNGLQLSPNGKYLSVEPDDPNTGVPHISIVDLARGVLNRLTPGETADLAAVLSPDGRVAFTYVKGAIGDLYVTLANGAGTPEPLVKSSTLKHPNNWSVDGRYVIYDDHHATQRQDLWILPMSGDHKPIPFLTTAADETDAEFSPDGKYVVYSSNESGRREVYVRDFAPDLMPAVGSGKWQISAAGGAKPRWRQDGKEIFYLDITQKMMAVPIKTGATLEPGVAVPLFDVKTAGFTPFVVTPDGRFIINTVPDTSALTPPITVLLHWQRTLIR